MPEIHNGKVRYTNREVIEAALMIKDKRRQLVPFRFNRAQEYYWNKRTRRNLILKARQKGLSKAIDADQLIDCYRNYGTSAVVISHERTATERLFEAVRFYIANAKHRMRVSIDSKREIRFPDKNSSYFIGTAGARAFGRGDTIHRAHLSEAAFYDDLQKILDGIEEAAEYGQIDIETTPNGRDQFFDKWEKAKAGKSSYTPIFIPWYIDGEYSIDSLDKKEKEGLSASMQEMFAIPDDQFINDLKSEDKEFMTRVANEWNILLTAGMMKWRTYKIWDKDERFFQEYPEDDVSCFLQSGRSVFRKISLQTSKKIPLDNLDAWKVPTEEKDALMKRRLTFAVDGATGQEDGDRHVFCAIDSQADGKSYVVFEIASNEPIDAFWNKIKKIIDKGYRYTLAIEDNGIGIAHVRKAKELGLVFEEFTTGTQRADIVADLEEGYRKEELVETYAEADDELRAIVYNEKEKAEAPKGKHDDRMMARAIAWRTRNAPTPSVEWL